MLFIWPSSQGNKPLKKSRDSLVGQNDSGEILTAAMVLLSGRPGLLLTKPGIHLYRFCCRPNPEQARQDG